MDPRIRTWAEVDLDNLEHNYREIRNKFPKSRFAALCKADAYGHGAVPVAKCLEKAGADMLAVSCFEEAAELRKNGVKCPVLLLAPSPAFLAPKLSELNAAQAVGDIETAREMNKVLDGRKLDVHIKLETGMGRTGFNVLDDDTVDKILELLSMENLNVCGVFTHFAVSDEYGDKFTDEQLRRFTETIKKAEDLSGKSLGIKHCANSGAVINYSETGFDMIRPGIILYGIYPAAEKGGLDLCPVMSLKTRVYCITEHHAGDTISYGRTYRCDRDTRIAVLPIGYGDGLHRVLSNKMEVLINGRRAKQIGRICMDMCMVDITDLPDVKVGDIVTVFGSGLSVDEQAEKAGTISYELLCALTPRVPRVYIRGGSEV